MSKKITKLCVKFKNIIALKPTSTYKLKTKNKTTPNLAKAIDLFNKS